MNERRVQSRPPLPGDSENASGMIPENVPRRVLVVDDDPSMRAALRRLLLGAGFEPELFQSGTHFLDAADLAQPGCVLLERKASSQVDEQARRWIRSAVESTRRLSMLIRDLLEVSRVDSRAQSFTQVPLDGALC